ncbi:MAG: glycosyltransferase family 2 protein [Acidobacteriota bacterium]
MPLPSAVTVGVPVYNAESFVSETLESLQAQSFTELSIIVSVDRSDDASVEECRGFAGDPRFDIVAQPQRLGWIGNCRWLMGRVSSAWFMLLSHDDLLLPNTLERLVRAAEQAPAAAAVFGDALTFGTSQGVRFHAPSLRGGPLGRLATYLVEHFDALAFRGLIRTDAARASGGLQPNSSHDFAAEAIWMFKLAWQGELIRIEGADWRKRMQPGTVSDGWLHWPAERRREAWISHCVEMMAFLATLELPPGWISLLAHAGLLRLLRATSSLGPYAEVSALDHSQRVEMVRAYRQLLEAQLSDGKARHRLLQATAIAAEAVLADGE